MIPRPELTERFESRHLGPTEAEIEAMLAALGYDAIEALAADAVPPAIRSTEPADLPEAISETALERRLRAIAGRNAASRSYIGMGYSAAVTPPVILRNILENPGWYTQYTPLPGRDLAGPPRGAPQLPDDGHRPHRASGRERLPPGRRQRGRRGDVPPPEPGEGRPPRLPRRRGLPSADDRRRRDPGAPARDRCPHLRSRTRGRRRRRLRGPARLSDDRRRGAAAGAVRPGSARRGRRRRRGHRPPRPHPPNAAG